MKITKAMLFVCPAGRRVGGRRVPVSWGVDASDMAAPAYASPGRFESLASGYEAGQSRFAEFVDQRPELPPVEAKRRIGFLDKAETVSCVLPKLRTPRADTLDDVIALDASAHRVAFDLLPVRARDFPAPFFRAPPLRGRAITLTQRPSPC